MHRQLILALAVLCAPLAAQEYPEDYRDGYEGEYRRLAPEPLPPAPLLDYGEWAEDDRITYDDPPPPPRVIVVPPRVVAAPSRALPAPPPAVIAPPVARAAPPLPPKPRVLVERRPTPPPPVIVERRGPPPPPPVYVERRPPPPPPMRYEEDYAFEDRDDYDYEAFDAPPPRYGYAPLPRDAQVYHAPGVTVVVVPAVTTTVTTTRYD